MIFVVLTVFGVCGVGILLLLRPIKKEEEDEREEAEKEKDNEVCWQPSFLYHKMLILSLPLQTKESELLLKKMPSKESSPKPIK